MCDNAPFNVEPKWFPHTHQRIITKGHPENSGKCPPEHLLISYPSHSPIRAVYCIESIGSNWYKKADNWYQYQNDK